MHKELIHILDKFKLGEIIEPLLIDNNTVYEVVNYLNGTNFLSIQELENEYIPNLFVFKTEEKSFKIEKAREIIEKVNIRSSGDFNIFLIEEIDKFTEQAGNSLLKTFEDIPPKTLFLLTTNSRENILETIFSRILYFSSNNIDLIFNPEIKEKINMFFNGNKINFIEYIYSAKLQKSDYLGILIYLKDKALSGFIKNKNVIEKIEKGIFNIYSTNANAKWIVDNIVLDL